MATTPSHSGALYAPTSSPLLKPCLVFAFMMALLFIMAPTDYLLGTSPSTHGKSSGTGGNGEKRLRSRVSSSRSTARGLKEDYEHEQQIVHPQISWSPLPAAGCPNRNYPGFNSKFWQEQPGFEKFLKLHNEMVEVATHINAALSVDRQDTLGNLTLRLLTLGYEAALAVRDNPIIGRVPDSLRSPVVEVRAAAGLVPNVEVDPFRLEAIEALEQQLNDNSTDQSAVLYSGIYPLRNALLTPNKDLRKALQRLAAINNNAIFTSEFTERVTAQCRKRNRAKLDPEYKPTDFFDFGARQYTKDSYDPEWNQLGTSWHKITHSSIRFFELYYPEFNQNRMNIKIHEVNKIFAKSYVKEFLPSHRKARLNMGAVWTHGNGLNLYMSDMLTVKDQARRTSSTTCMPTQNVLRIIEKTKKLATLKIDIEYSEWAVFETLAHHPRIMQKLGEVFLECHSWGPHSGRIFPVPPQKLAPETLGAKLLAMASGVGLDCYLLHDMVRSFGVPTNYWP